MSQDERKARAKALWALGFTSREIAKDVGVSQTTVLRWCDEGKQRYDRAYRRPPRTDYHREYQGKRRAAKPLA